jgi:hypothetical protein
VLCMYIAGGLSAYSRPTLVSSSGSRNAAVRKTNPLGHDFWTRFIPQVSHGSLVVKRAITSVASVLESTQSQSHGPLTYIEACGRHQVNVRSIIKAAGETDAEYALLASLLFASCELALGAFDAGILHLTAGSNVLKERMAYLAQNNSSHGLAASILSENIEPIFAAYSRITSVYGIDLVSGDDLTWAAHHGCVQIPACFLNTDQAHAHLRSTIHQIFSNTSRRTLADFEQQQTRLDQWTTALNAFESHENTNKTSRVMSPMTCFLRNQHRLAQVFLSIARSSEETDPHLFDHFTFDFTWILAQYDLMRFDKVLVTERVELIPSLFIIATKTRNMQIRNEALRLLEAMTRVEANWDSRTASLIARELIKQEAPVSTSLTLLTQVRKTRLPSVARICIHNVSGMWVSIRAVLCASTY